MTSPVAAILGREIEQVARFIAILNEEQDALKRGDVNALPDLISRKTPLVESLNTLEGERLLALNLPAAESGRGAMDIWLAQNGNDSLATVNWKKLLKFANEAKTLHELNAQLVDLHLRQTSEILSILTAPPEAATSLYGSSGQPLPATGSRIVDSA